VRRNLLAIAALVSAFSAAACARDIVEVQQGMASYYADSLHGEITASGETYDKNALTAAHPSLPFGTRLRVTNLENGKSVEVTVNDRGPHVDDRILDLSAAAARQLELHEAGLTEVKIEVYGD
jgi:peptidoglycan lytic transglycosylase